MMCYRCRRSTNIVWLSRQWLLQNRKKWWGQSDRFPFSLEDGEYLCERCFELEAKEMGVPADGTSEMVMAVS